MEDYRKEFWEGMKELRESQKETDRMIKELSREIDKLSKAVGELNGVWKAYSEKIIFDNIEEALKNAGFDNFLISRNVKRSKGSDHLEVDILSVGGDYVVVIETKTTLRVRDVRRFLRKLKERFLEFFPEFRGFRIFGAMVGINLQEGVESFATKNGILVFRHRDGGKVEILNPKDFQPKDFSIH